MSYLFSLYLANARETVCQRLEAVEAALDTSSSSFILGNVFVLVVR